MADSSIQIITTDSDVVAARQRGRAVAAQIGFSIGDQTVIAAAISELARNILLYARHGEVVMESVTQGDRVGIKVIARDQGPGIRDLQRALTDGYSTSGGLGLGLPGARRLMDEFEVITSQEGGTTVSMKKWKA